MDNIPSNLNTKVTTTSSSSSTLHSQQTTHTPHRTCTISGRGWLTPMTKILSASRSGPRSVLLAARAYVSGRAQVRYYSSPTPNNDDYQVDVSSSGRWDARKKFRNDMVELYPHMVALLPSHGISVEYLFKLRVDKSVSKVNVVKVIKKAWSRLFQYDIDF